MYPITQWMYERESDVFAERLSKLNDRIAKARILARLKSVRFSKGNGSRG